MVIGAGAGVGGWLSQAQAARMSAASMILVIADMVRRAIIA